jgi:arylformamidase
MPEFAMRSSSGVPVLCRPLLVFTLLGGLLAGSAVHAAEPSPVTANIQVLRNIAYYEGKDADPVRHRLDLYLPAGQKGFPVVVFVHGGAWQHGDKNHFGIYARLGQCFARHGIGMVSPNYRLSPAVKHPEHARDVARAFAWTYRNIAKYGGRPDELFLGGHSAGGHLAALVATDASYLKEQGLTLAAVRGAIPVSGVYAVPNHPLLHRVFGKEPAGYQSASPINHVCAAAPPFLIIYADNDLPSCAGPGAQAFCNALRGKGCLAETCEAVHRNHISVLVDATTATDPVMQHVLAFVGAQVALHRLAGGGPDGVDFLTGLLARWAEESRPPPAKGPTTSGGKQRRP